MHNADFYHAIRLAIWEKLRPVALPDSRFSFDFLEYIPDFQGSCNAINNILKSNQYKRSSCIFITPDNCLSLIRENAIKDEKKILISTYGIKRGFILLDRSMVPNGQEIFASTLDGLEYFGRKVSLSDIKKDLRRIDLLVTGASAVSIGGVRFGKGHGFFDIEWGIFTEMGLVSTDVPIFSVVHDVQVIYDELIKKETDITVDYIFTQNEVIRTIRQSNRPHGIKWDIVTEQRKNEIPVLEELYNYLSKNI